MGSHINRVRPASRDVLDSLRRIVQVLREASRRAEQQLGISGAQLFVLERLTASPSRSLNELAELTHTHQSSVSTVVARLVRRGLVARRRAAGDARRLELVATDRGIRLTTGAPGAVQDRLIQTIEHLPPRSRRQLASLLRRIVAGLDAVDRRPRMFFDDNHGRHRR
jgi:DNA-binding MarR family transcriptional regulator